MRHNLIPESHYVDQAGGIQHVGNCAGTLCPECGCCVHCADDGHCLNCRDRDCGCSL